MATVNYISCKKQCPASLTGVSNYVKQEKKTFLPEQNRHLISGQNCSAQFSQLEFLATRDQFRKTSSQYFYHYTQSFHPEEPVTGELAHTIAQEFAARAWPDNSRVFTVSFACQTDHREREVKRMASIRKRGESYLLVVSMGYDAAGKRCKPQQKTVHPPQGLTPKQTDKWLKEQAVLLEISCRKLPADVDRSITLNQYIDIWLETIAPNKLATSTLHREKQDIARIRPHLGHYKLIDLRPEHFKKFYADMRKAKNSKTGKPLSEATVEGLHSCLCGILSDAMEGGFIDRNPAWRTYRYAGKKKEKPIADEEPVVRLIRALEEESIKYETYFKLLIATGIRRGECCGLKWCDFDFASRKLHIFRNVVKVTGEEIEVKEPKTASGDRYVYFSSEMESLLTEYRKVCQWETEAHEQRQLTEDDYVFRRQGLPLPMTPSTFTWRFKKILKSHGLPENLNVHSLRHTNASLLIAGGADVTTVASLLGHSQPSTTLDIYSHAFDKNRKEASQALHEGLEI